MLGTTSRATRRTLLAAACGSCVAALAGCAGYGAGRASVAAPADLPSAAQTGGPTSPETPAPDTSAPETAAPETAAPAEEEPAPADDVPEPEPAAAPPANALVATSAIPVGGGMVFADEDVVVTQPSAGRFAAFSATCTHQGCAVTDVSGGNILCPCHGSAFAVADGSVTGGPAEQALPARAFSVVGGSIVLA